MFPSNIPVTNFMPSSVQRDAMAFLQSGAPRFANPITAQLGTVKANLVSPGGFPLGEVSNLNSILTSVVPADTAGASAINSQIQQYIGPEMFSLTQQLQTYNLDSLAAITPTLDTIEPTIAIQDQRVVSQLPQVMSTVSTYSSLKESFSPPVNTNVMINNAPSIVQTPSLSTCDTMKTVLGSLGGAADFIFDSIHAGVSSIGSLFGAASNETKLALQAAIGAISSIASAIREQVLEWVAQGSNMFTPPDLTLFDSLKSAMAGVGSSISAFMNSAMAAGGMTIDFLKDTISGVASSITASVSDLSNMIMSELGELNKVINYIKDAGIAMVFPSFSVCGKSVVNNVCGAAGAGPLVALVS